ncbi:hypothetical protein [Actinomadura livida]|nr:MULTISPECIES: hypothetical protein [Actinomadura]MBB4773620.1 hypothetical protein [Actinomadura catellatispora]
MKVYSEEFSVLPALARQSAEDAAVILNARTGPEPDETTAAGRVVHLVETSNR